MMARAGSGWQTVLADLSLILFMVTAAVVAEPPAPNAAATTSPAAPALPALGEPVAVWSDVRGGPALKDWLVQTARDPRLRLTIVAAPDRAEAALALAAGSGRPARVLVEPGASGPPLAMLTYDQAEVARGLQQGGAVADKELAR